MKNALKGKIEKLVNMYKDEMKEAFVKIEEVEKSTIYTPEKKNEMLLDMKAILRKGDHEYNKALKDLLQVERSAILNATINKPGDYQNMITNALNQINMLGDKLTDKVAFEIVKPFFGDLETMRNLHSIISNRYGADGLNHTSYMLGIYDKILKGLDDLESWTSYLFNGGSILELNLGFKVNTKAVFEKVEHHDHMLNQVDGMIRFSYEDVKDSIDQSVKDEMFGKDGAE